MRSGYTWSFVVGCAGLLLLFIHVAIGQVTRELFDPTLGTSLPRPAPSTPSVLSPPVTPSAPVTPIAPMMPTLATTPQQSASPGNEPAVFNTSGYISSAASPGFVPISEEMTRLWRRELPTLTDSEEETTQPTNTEMTRQVLDRLTTVLEDETEDEREERELSILRHQAEQLVDPARREMALERLVQAEAAFQSRIERRAVDEVGADLFYTPRLKEQYISAGWCQLFDGHTDFGWKVQDAGYYGGGEFTFGQGEIRSNPYRPGMVYTVMPFCDLSLQFDYWAEKDSEVLLLLKTPPNPDDLNTSCYTFVLNSGRTDRPRGLLLGKHEYSLPQLRTMREIWDNPASEGEGSWHTFRVRIEEGNIQVWMDRRSAITYFDPHPISAGHIAFLVAKGEARFRNVIWQPRQTLAVFDATGIGDLPWHDSEELELIGDNSRGFRLLRGSVESIDVFGNFVLQMQYNQGINSGRSSLFVRGLPRQKNTGYEISLQNFPGRRDRESIVGVDAGSFRQIKDARYVRAQDMQWTHLTVAVMDRQLATWVNGVPVCQIEDPRTRIRETGPFLAPGTIRLSVPENNPAFQFRQLTVSPVAE